MNHQTRCKLVGKKKSTRWCVFTNAIGNSFFINAFCLCYSFCHLRFAFFCALSHFFFLKMDVIIKFCFAWSVTWFQSSLIFLQIKGKLSTGIEQINNVTPWICILSKLETTRHAKVTVLFICFRSFTGFSSTMLCVMLKLQRRIHNWRIELDQIKIHTERQDKTTD